MLMKMLSGKIALVTGGRGGIGRAIVSRFLKEGATVYAADLTPEGSLDNHKEDGSVFIKLDVTSEKEVSTALSKIEEEEGKLDILVNAAGIEIEKTIEQTSLEEWNLSFAVNVTGTFLTSKYSLPLMRKAAKNKVSTSIINFGSYDGFIADPGLAAYCATKGGVISLMRSIALDYVGEGVRCNAICPGTVDTPWVDRMVATYPDPVQTKKQMTNRQPMGRLGQPHEIASGAVYLASKDSNFVTGSCLVIDGGLTMQ